MMLRIWSRISLLTQLGLSVAAPPILLVFLALWMQKRFAVGEWVLLCAILLGVFSGAVSVYSFVRREMEREVRLLNREESLDASKTGKESDHS